MTAVRREQKRRKKIKESAKNRELGLRSGENWREIEGKRAIFGGQDTEDPKAEGTKRMERRPVNLRVASERNPGGSLKSQPED